MPQWFHIVKRSSNLHKFKGKFSRQSGGRGQYGDVHIEFTPNETGAGFEFENSIVGGVVPREYIPSVEGGLKDAMENGVLFWLSINRC